MLRANKNLSMHYIPTNKQQLYTINLRHFFKSSRSLITTLSMTLKGVLRVNVVLKSISEPYKHVFLKISIVI